MNKAKRIKKIPCDIYSRVCGYFGPIREWNKGKQAEYKNRNELEVKKIVKNLKKT